MNKWIILAPLILMATSTRAETQYFRCTGERGQTVFSEKSCGIDAETGIIKSSSAPAPSSSPEARTWAVISASNALREAESKVEQGRGRISSLEKERDVRLTALKNQRSQVSNNLAGAQLVTGLATEMQAVIAQYQHRIEREYRDIERLQEQSIRVRRELVKSAGAKAAKLE